MMTLKIGCHNHCSEIKFGRNITMGAIKKIHIVLSVVMLVIIVLMGGIFFIPKVLGYKPYNVLTGSMEPTYPVGSLIYVKKVAADTLKIGDVITMENGGTPITHRIIDIDSGQQLVYTQGDANQTADGATPFDEIKGKVAAIHFPFMGKIFQTMQSGNGRKVFIIAIIAFLFLWFVTDVDVKKR